MHNINEIIVEAIKPIVSECVADVYRGKESEYVTFSYLELPQVTAENGPSAILYSVRLHWFLPNGKNPLRKKTQLKRAIASIGDTYPTVVNASDKICQHYVFEFSVLGSGAD